MGFDDHHIHGGQKRSYDTGKERKGKMPQNALQKTTVRSCERPHTMQIDAGVRAVPEKMPSPLGWDYPCGIVGKGSKNMDRGPHLSQASRQLGGPSLGGADLRWKISRET